jgi:hypothetical protein
MDVNPKISDFTEDFVGEFLHWDGKFPATIRALLTKPGLLTADFMVGKRRRWLSPFRLYLTISIVYFLSGPVVERVTGYSEKTVAKLQVTGDSAAREDLKILSDSTTFVNAPELADNTVVKLIGGPGVAWRLIKNQSMLKDIVAEAVPKAMFVLMPFFAFLTWLAWRSSGKNYPTHLVFSFHVHSAWFVVLTAGNLIDPIGSIALSLVAQLLILVYCTWYVYVACREALGGTGSQVFWRSTLVGVLYAPATAAITTAAVVLAINAL